MNIVDPVGIDVTDLVSCSVPVDADAADYGAAWQGEWSSGDPYSTGNVVYKGIVLYESQVDDNADDPEVGVGLEIPSWLELGWINRWRMFDEYISLSSSSAVDEMVHTIAKNDVGHVCFYDVIANSMSVEILDAADAVVWDYSIDLLDAALDIGDWWEYYYLPYPDSKRDIIVELGWMINADLGEKIRITFSGSGQVSCGMCIPGLSIDLGQTQWSPEVGALSYGEITKDKWGRTKFVKGPTAKTIRGSLKIPMGSEDYVYRVLSSVLEKRVVFNLNNPGLYYDMLSVYGSIIDFNHVLYSRQKAICSIQIDGLI